MRNPSQTLTQTRASLPGTELPRRAALKGALWVLTGAASLAGGSAQADPDDEGFRIGGRPGRAWQMVGETRANKSVDRDEVRVRSDRLHSAIRLRVFHAPVEFFRVRIWFRNGSQRDIELRQFIERGGATRVIDLPGERRAIDRIVFWFKTPALARERATVQVWARG